MLVRSNDDWPSASTYRRNAEYVARPAGPEP